MSPQVVHGSQKQPKTHTKRSRANQPARCLWTQLSKPPTSTPRLSEGPPHAPHDIVVFRCKRRTQEEMGHTSGLSGWDLQKGLELPLSAHSVPCNLNCPQWSMCMVPSLTQERLGIVYKNTPQHHTGQLTQSTPTKTVDLSEIGSAGRAKGILIWRQFGGESPEQEGEYLMRL